MLIILSKINLDEGPPSLQWHKKYSYLFIYGRSRFAAAKLSNHIRINLLISEKNQNNVRFRVRISIYIHMEHVMNLLKHDLVQRSFIERPHAC